MRGAAKWVERGLWTIGFLALAIWLAVWGNARRQQAGGNRELDRRIKAELRSSPPMTLIQGDVIGRIEIPRLEISTIHPQNVTHSRSFALVEEGRRPVIRTG